MARPTAPESTRSQLTLAGHPADWRIVATALTSGGRPVLSGLVRSGLAGAGTDAVELVFEPRHAESIQRIATSVGVRLVAAHPSTSRTTSPA